MHFPRFSSAFNSQTFFAISLIFSTLVIPTVARSSTYRAQRLSVLDKAKLPLPVELIWEFPPGIWCENVAVRRNGQILVSVATAPKLYQVDPRKKRPPILLYSFPASTVTGIAELQPDVFYVATNNFTIINGNLENVPGSGTIWKVDLRFLSVRHGKPVQVSEVATFPKSELLNGVVVLNHQKGLLLVADSTLGLIWQLNIHTREIKIFANEYLTKAPRGAQPPVGVNGIKVRNEAVYFTNYDRGLIARIIVQRNETRTGPAVAVVTGLATVDDFNIGANGAFFAAQIGADALSYAPATGGDAAIIANITTNPTALAFGRRPEDAQSAYISCAGGDAEDFAPSSPSPPRGQIVKVDLKAFL